jgi:hypothetical protein
MSDTDDEKELVKSRVIREHKEVIDSQLKQVEEFSDLLESITSLENKKKVLWKHIYENALEDRKNAYILFTELYVTSKGKPNDHHLNGPIMAKYIERMSRANDQVLKLAELVQKAQDEEESVNEDDVYDQIKGI